MSLRSVRTRLTIDVQDYVSGINRAEQANEKFGKKATSVLKGVATGYAAIKLGGLVKESVQLEAAYSKTMAQVAVATKAPQSEIEQLDDLALKLGADTVFSAKESADAMLELAKGGLNPAQIQAGALADTLALASAGELDLGVAANTVVQAMGAFQLKAKDADVAAAALAGGANASSASVSDMTQALAQAGTEAHAAGLSISDTTAYLALFANSGIKGSDAGTSLRTMLSRLVPQTDEARAAMKALGLSYVDGNGKIVDAEQIAARTQKAFKGLTDEERTTALNTIFGADARRAANVIIDKGAAGLRKMKRETEDMTQTEKLAAAANSGTAGTLEELSGAIETAQIQLGKGLAPVVQEVTEGIADLVSSGDMEKWGREGGEAVVALAQELQPLLSTAKELGTSALPLMAQAGETVVDALQLASEVLNPLLELLGALPDGAQQILLVASAARMLSTRVNEMNLSFDAANVKSLAMRGGLLAAGVGLTTLTSSSTEAGSAVNALGQIASGVAVGFAVGGPWGAAIGGAGGLLSALAGKSDQAAAAQRRLDAFAAQVAATLDQQTGALTEATTATVAKGLADSGAFDAARKLGLGYDTVTAAALGNKNAQREVNAAVQGYLQRGDTFVNMTSKAGQEILGLAASVGASADGIDRQRKSIDQSGEALAALDGSKADVSVNQRGNALTALQTIRAQMAFMALMAPVNLYVNTIKRTTEASGGYTGMRLPAGYAAGGKVPGVAPSDPTRDNVFALGAATGQPLMVRSGEWIINQTQSEKNDRWLRLINQGLVLDDIIPGFADGGRYETFSSLTKSSKLDLAQQQQRIRDLERALKETETVGKDKRKRRVLRGLDREVTQLELREEKAELAKMRRENRRLRSYGTPAQEKRRQEAKEKAAKAREERAEAAQKAREDRAKAEQDQKDAIASASGEITGEFSMGEVTSAAGLERRLDRLVVDSAEFIQILAELKKKGASDLVLNILRNEGPSKAAIRVGRQLLADEVRLARINKSASGLTAIGNTYGNLTAGTGSLTTAQSQTLVQIQALDVTQVTGEIQRVVRHELATIANGGNL